MKRFAPLILLVLAACVDTSGRQYVKAEGSGKARDVEYCRAYAEAHIMPPSAGGLAGIFQVEGQKKSQFNLCMMDKGYRKR